MLDKYELIALTNQYLIILSKQMRQSFSHLATRCAKIMLHVASIPRRSKLTHLFLLCPPSEIPTMQYSSSKSLRNSGLPSTYPRVAYLDSNNRTALINVIEQKKESLAPPHDQLKQNS